MNTEELSSKKLWTTCLLQRRDARPIATSRLPQQSPVEEAANSHSWRWLDRCVPSLINSPRTKIRCSTLTHNLHTHPWKHTHACIQSYGLETPIQAPTHRNRAASTFSHAVVRGSSLWPLSTVRGLLCLTTLEDSQPAHIVDNAKSHFSPLLFNLAEGGYVEREYRVCLFF